MSRILMQGAAASLRETFTGCAKCAGGQISAGLNRLFPSPAGDRFGILMYHRIAPAPPGVPCPTRNVTPERFRRQMEGLLEAGYRACPLQDVIGTCLRGGSLPAKTFVITFDDGYRNVYLNAYPTLQQLGLPATIFATTAYLNTERAFPFDRWGCAVQGSVSPDAWAPLSWQQCEEMQAVGLVQIGTHTHTHSDFRGCPEALEQDLRLSLTTLQGYLGTGPYPFAFPFGGRRQGYAADSLVRVAQNSGATCALTTEIGLVSPSSSPFGWGRFEAVQWDTPATLDAKLQGWYDWMGWLREGWRRVCICCGCV